MKGKITEGLEWSPHGYKGAASCLSLSHYPPARGPPEQPLISITWHSRAIELIGLCEPCNKGFCAFLRVFDLLLRAVTIYTYSRVIPKWCPWTLQRTKEKGTKLLLWLTPYLFPLIPLLSALFNSLCLWRGGLVPQSIHWWSMAWSPFPLVFFTYYAAHLHLSTKQFTPCWGARYRKDDLHNFCSLITLPPHST